MSRLRERLERFDEPMKVRKGEGGLGLGLECGLGLWFGVEDGYEEEEEGDSQIPKDVRSVRSRHTWSTQKGPRITADRMDMRWCMVTSGMSNGQQPLRQAGIKRDNSPFA